MLIKIGWFLLLLVDSYLLFSKLREKHLGDKINRYMSHKSEKYYHDMLKYYEKNKKIKLKAKTSLFTRITLKLDRAGIKSDLLINPVTILLFSCFLFGVCYLFMFHFLHIILLSLLLSIPALFVPMILIGMIEERNNSKIEKATLDFLLQLKNYTQINNDIVYALEEVRTVEPLQGHIRTFLIELNSGVHFDVAMYHLKEKMNSEALQTFFSNVQYCYLYGGSFSKLITKNYQIFSELHKEKDKRKEETKSARMVLWILVILDLLVYVVTIKNHPENYLLMQKNIVGKIILYWNFLSMWFLLLLSNKVKKLDY